MDKLSSHQSWAIISRKRRDEQNNNYNVSSADLFISDSKILNPGHMNFICKFTYEFIGKFYIWIFTYEFIGKLCSIIRSIWTHAAPVGAAGKIYMSYVFRKQFFVHFLLNFEANQTSSMIDFRISANLYFKLWTYRGNSSNIRIHM